MSSNNPLWVLDQKDGLATGSTHLRTAALAQTWQQGHPASEQAICTAGDSGNRKGCLYVDARRFRKRCTNAQGIRRGAVSAGQEWSGAPLASGAGVIYSCTNPVCDRPINAGKRREEVDVEQTPSCGKSLEYLLDRGTPVHSDAGDREPGRIRTHGRGAGGYPWYRVRGSCNPSDSPRVPGLRRERHCSEETGGKDLLRGGTPGIVVVPHHNLCSTSASICRWECARVRAPAC